MFILVLYLEFIIIGKFVYWFGCSLPPFSFFIYRYIFFPFISFCGCVCICFFMWFCLYSFAFTICPRVCLSVLWFFCFFFFLLLFISFIFNKFLNNFILITLFYFIFFFLPFFFSPFSSEPCGWQGLGAPAGYQACASEVGELSSWHWSTRDLLAPHNIKQWKLSQRFPAQH